MDEKLDDLHGDRSAQHVESLLALNPDWYNKHKNNFVVYGNSTRLASEATAEKAMEVATEVGEEKGIRPDYIAFIDRQFKLDVIAARNAGGNSHTQDHNDHLSL